MEGYELHYEFRALLEDFDNLIAKGAGLIKRASFVCEGADRLYKAIGHIAADVGCFEAEIEEVLDADSGENA